MASTANRSPIVITFPFSIFPVNSGGALRGYYLLRELARAFDTEALVLDHAAEIDESIRAELGSDLVGLRVRQIDRSGRSVGLIGKIANRLRTFSYCRSFAVSSNTTAIATAELLKQVVHGRRPQAVVLTNLESWVCGSMLGQYFPTALRIIDMHNLEHVLRAQQLKSGGRDVESDPDFIRLRREAASLPRCADAVIACSDHDRDALRYLTAQQVECETVPNGVACERAPLDDRADKNESKQILFCGTLSYPPNIDGLNWFFQNAWPQIRKRHPDATLNVVGRGFANANFSKLEADPAINLVGEADDLRPHYHDSGVAICPLRMGSGTRLKLLESMSFGNPTVTTSTGCEGINVRDGAHLLVRDDATGFADAVCTLLGNKEMFDRLRRDARTFVEGNYDWAIIGKRAVAQIRRWSESASLRSLTSDGHA